MIKKLLTIGILLFLETKAFGNGISYIPIRLEYDRFGNLNRLTKIEKSDIIMLKGGNKFWAKIQNEKDVMKKCERTAKAYPKAWVRDFQKNKLYAKYYGNGVYKLGESISRIICITEKKSERFFKKDEKSSFYKTEWEKSFENKILLFKSDDVQKYDIFPKL